MRHGNYIETVGWMFWDPAQSKSEFGGLNNLFSGDFQEILRVLCVGFISEVSEALVRSSDLFSALKVLHLTEYMRRTALMQDSAADEEIQEFPDSLLKLGEQRAPGTSMDNFHFHRLHRYSGSIFWKWINAYAFSGIQMKYGRSWLMSRVIRTH